MNIATRLNLRASATLLFALLALSVGSLAAAASDPAAVVRSTTVTLRENIGENLEHYRSDTDAFYAMVDEQLTGQFDTMYIARIILGRHLKDASPEQVAAFEEAFKSMLMRQYADQLLEHYDDVEVEIQPARIDGTGTKANVDAALMRPNRQPISLQFRMRLADGQWKVWDIVAENISLVTNFRTQVDSAVRRSDLESVIAGLRNGTLTIDGRADGDAS